MSEPESAREYAPGQDRSNASGHTTAGNKNPQDWHPSPEIVTEIRRALLDSESSHSLASEYPADRKTIQALAKYGRGTGDIGPIRALGSTGHWVPAEEMVTDGGEDNGGDER